MINNRTAEKILLEIKKANKILLTLHVSPDPDGIASVLALNNVLEKMGKKTKLISFSQIPPRYAFFSGLEKIQSGDLAKINLNDFNLLITLDSADESKVTRNKFPDKFPRGFKIINIDHHVTSSKFGTTNLVEKTASSTAEVLYDLFGVWKIKIEKKLADLLFLGIFSDTGCFQYPLTSAKTFTIASDLLGKGADLQECVLREFRSFSFKTLKYWGKVLDNLQLDESKRFVWSSISQEEREELGIDPIEIEGAASFFAPIVSGTEFGIILHEESKNLIRGSLRSRGDFDVSVIALEFNGGGHKQAAGFVLRMSLDEAEKLVLEKARDIVKNYQ